jgi:hypothetical protein
MQDALGIVIFVVVGVGAVIAIVSLFGRSRLYDDIGRGGLSIGEDRDMRPRGAQAPAAAVLERRARRGDPPDARGAQRAARRPGARDRRRRGRAGGADPGGGSTSSDPEILEEVRALVRARNSRRIAAGQSRSDEDAEVARSCAISPVDPG